MLAQVGASAAGRLVVEKRPARVSRREGVIEVVEQGPAGQEEIPRLGAIEQVVSAAEAGLVFADHALQAVVHPHHLGRNAIVEIEDRNGGVGRLDLGRAVGHIQRNQVLLRKILFRGDDLVDDPMLPVHAHPVKVGLVADLVVEIVKSAQLLDDLSHERQLHLQQVLVLEREDLFSRACPNPVDVVRRVQRADLPELVLVHAQNRFISTTIPRSRACAMKSRNREK